MHMPVQFRYKLVNPQLAGCCQRNNDNNTQLIMILDDSRSTIELAFQFLYCCFVVVLLL
mgnify:CR=1 FL=1